jgi:2-polyprenyl-3-methyl-5-hydroxy-6-metoxy-1,4-benzoquinol methylase
MTDHVEINRLNWDERAAIHARDTTGDYMLDRFRAGEDALHVIEATELGDISGKRVLHLQCHIGQDTLCLVRRGATATGLDFSSAALSVARRLSDETGLKADFVEGTVYQAPDLTPGPFDLVFTTWGTICWLPDVKKWAEVIASVLAPSGELYFADAHPGLACWKNTLEDLYPLTTIKRLPTGRCTSQMRPRTLETRLSCRISRHGSGYTRSRQSSADSLMPDSQLRCFVNTRPCLGEA